MIFYWVSINYNQFATREVGTYVDCRTSQFASNMPRFIVLVLLQIELS